MPLIDGREETCDYPHDVALSRAFNHDSPWRAQVRLRNALHLPRLNGSEEVCLAFSGKVEDAAVLPQAGDFCRVALREVACHRSEHIQRRPLLFVFNGLVQPLQHPDE